MHPLVFNHNSGGTTNNYNNNYGGTSNYYSNDGTNSYTYTYDSQNSELTSAEQVLINGFIAFLVILFGFIIVASIMGVDPMELILLICGAVGITGFFIASLPSLILIGLFLKYYVLYAMVGFFYVGWWEHILPVRNELADDFIRGVTYPVHVAYMNVQNLYANSFHILDTD